MNTENSEHTRLQLAVITGLNQLHDTLRWESVDITEARISDREMEAYLSRNLDEDTQADRDFEKRISTAIYLAGKRKNPISRKIAKCRAAHAVRCLRAARLTVLYHDRRIDAKTYKEEVENNFVANTLAITRRLKNKYKFKGALKAAIYVSGVTASPLVVGGLTLIYALLPKKIKEKLKNKAGEIARDTVTAVRRGLTFLKEKGREAATAVANTLADAANRIVQKAGAVVNKVKEKTSKVKNALASFANNAVKRMAAGAFNWLVR